MSPPSARERGNGNAVKYQTWREKALTPRQRQVLSYLRERHHAEGGFPTLEEIARAFDFDRRAAWDHLRALVRKGEVIHNPQAPRSRRFRLA